MTTPYLDRRIMGSERNAGAGMKDQPIEDQARNAWIAGATMKHIASVLNVSVQKATAIIHKGATVPPTPQELTQ